MFGDKKTYKTKISANFIYKNRKFDIEHRKIINKKEYMCLIYAELNHTTLNKTRRLTKWKDLSILENLYLLNFNFSNLILVVNSFTILIAPELL